MQRVAEKVMSIKDGIIQNFNDYGLTHEEISIIKCSPSFDNEWEAKRARGLESLIESVKADKKAFDTLFNVYYDMVIGQDVLEVIELWQGSKYELYVQYREV